MRVMIGLLLILGVFVTTDRGAWAADDIVLTEAERLASQKFLIVKAREAKAHFDGGRYQLAYRIADAILTLAPDVSFRQEMRELRRDAEARHLGETVVSVRFEIGDGAPFPIDKLEGVVAVENINEDPLIIAAEEEEPLGLCEFQVFEVYEDASSWTSRGSKVLRATGPYRLDRGEQRADPISLDLRRSDRPPVLQWIRVGGSFRPTELRSGDEVIQRSIPWQSRDVIVVAEDLNDLRDDPQAGFDTAIEAGDSRRIVAAGYLWARELAEQGEIGSAAKEATIDRLIAQISTDQESPLDRLYMRLLEEFTGEELRPTKEAWRRWHRRRKS
ncbi:MAG: hypothetical protein AAF488_16765 [Planctomycetota bacterium]